MQKRLEAIEEKLAEADPLTRLQLVQERMDLQRQLEAADTTVDLQGLEDEVVPPHQTERMFHALRAKGIPTVYLAFEGEQHATYHFNRAEDPPA